MTAFNMVCLLVCLLWTSRAYVRLGHQVPPQPHQIGTVADTYALSRSAGFGSEVQKRILLGAYALSAE